MKKVLYLFILFFPYHFFAQNNYKFIYKLTFVKDSLQPKNTQNVLYTLFYRDNQSTFISNKKIEMDSILINAKNNPNLSLSMLNNLSLSSDNSPQQIISKNFSTNSSKINESIYKDNYEYAENNNELKWTLINDTISIVNLKCKKAEINDRGRKYYSWYSEEIPFPDGPYKFCGLPGLIFKISDVKNNFDFELVGITKWDGKLPELINKKTIQTSRENFLKAQKNFRENYVNMAAQNGFYLSEEGKKFKEKQIKEKFSNPIELK